MKKYTYTRTTENLSFNIDLTHKIKSLGQASSLPDEVSVLMTNSFDYNGVSRLNEVMSFDIDRPYIVGINGVLDVNDKEVKYRINDDIYITDIISGETVISATSIRNDYENKNYFYDDNKIGVDAVIKTMDEISLDRGKISVIDKFSKLKNAKNIIDIESIGNGFYKIINQTVK